MNRMELELSPSAEAAAIRRLLPNGLSIPAE
jgi:hypothetical protein